MAAALTQATGAQVAAWLNTDAAGQLGVWTVDEINAHVALFPYSNPCLIAFTEASDLLVAAGYTVATLPNAIYMRAHPAMMDYTASLWLQKFRENLDALPGETLRDAGRYNLTRRIAYLQNRSLSNWLKISITPDWAPSSSAYTADVIKR